MDGRWHRSRRGGLERLRTAWLLLALLALMFSGTVGVTPPPAQAADPQAESAGPVTGELPVAPTVPTRATSEETEAGAASVSPPSGAETFTPAASCTNRPLFRVTTSMYTDGRMLVLVSANPGNSLRALHMHSARASFNAAIDVGVTIGAISPMIVPLPAGTTQFGFFVRPAFNGNAPVTASFIVQDECSFYQSFAGGGRNVQFGAAVTGVVINSCNNKAVTRGIVSFQTLGGVTLSYPISSTGTFTAFIPRGPGPLVAIASGFANGGVNRTWLPGPQNGVLISLNGLNGLVDGVVRNAVTGAAIPGATVTISGGGSTTTNSSGGFTFTNAPVGTRTITASATGFDDGSTTAVICTDEPARPVISLQRRGTLGGVVASSICQAPIVGATVAIPSRSLTTTTIVEGGYAFFNMPAGSFAVTASATGYTSRTQNATVTNGTITTLNFLLDGGPTGTIKGVVTNAATGSGISGATVSVIGSTTQTGTTDGTGNYVIPNIPPGVVSMSVVAPGFQSGSVPPGTLCPGDTVTINITLTPNAPTTGSISGIITNCAGGAVVSGVTVSTATGQTATTDGAGAYTITNVPVGTAQVTAAKTGFTSKTLPVAVIGGATATLSMCLDAVASTGTLTGSVKDCLGNPLNGVAIIFQGTTIAATQANGTFSAPTVQTGTGEIRASLAGYSADVRTVTIVAGTNAPITFTICANTTDNNIKVILTWGQRPRDLDAHMSGPDGTATGRFHSRFPRPGSPVPWVSLDVDDTDGGGPEVITVTPNPATPGQFVPGEYRYWVHLFPSSSDDSPRPPFSASGAHVVLKQGNQTLKVYDVGASGGANNLWYVFKFTVTAGGLVTPTDVFTFSTGTQSTVF